MRPFQYWGGKQKMLPHILPIIPKHDVYVEPFCGGASVFWAKDPSPIEILNDIDGELINFYVQAKTNFHKLEKMILATPYSRQVHDFAGIVHRYPHFFGPTRRAWAVWTLANQSYAGKINHGWGYSLVAENGRDTVVKKFVGYKKRFSDVENSGKPKIVERLENVQLEHQDALNIIRQRDGEKTFFYIDPPYPKTVQSYCKEFSQHDFDCLLSLLQKIKGKFILSSYLNDSLFQYAENNGWIIETFKKTLSGKKAKHGEKRTAKIECLTRNFQTETETVNKNYLLPIVCG